MPPPLAAAAELGISYRPVEAADEPLLREIYESTRAEEMGMVPWDEATKQRFLDHQFNAQHSHYNTHFPEAEWLVILHGGDAAGRLYVDREEGFLHIIDIALLPKARGQGIGGAILHDLLAEARKAKEAVVIYVEKNNPAMRLYLRLGFEKVADEGVYDRMHWQPENG
jgi:ribosomal protein S18 acetylase RimI-like enzyme